MGLRKRRLTVGLLPRLSNYGFFFVATHLPDNWPL